MLTRLSIRDFQSHRKTDLSLGPFTVIVGPSSSGKTAVVRALRLIAQNARGTSYVRHGAPRARVEVYSAQFQGDPLDAQIRVAVDRGKTVNAYELQLPGDSSVQVFTKCGTSSPETIQAALDFGDGELWLAGQFDRPFLLDDTGSQVARVLGELTNVTMIYAAVRELNRRSGAAKQTHTSLAVELDRVKDQIKGYVDLRAQLDACTAAEGALERAGVVAERRRSLVGCVLEVEDAGARVVEARAALRPVPDVNRLVKFMQLRSRLGELVLGVGDAQVRRDSVSVVVVPDVVRLSELAARRVALCEAIEAFSVGRTHLEESVARASHAVQECAQARARLGTVLVEAGECPVCGADAVHAQLERVGH